jgi:hypothetical protein
MDGCIDLLVRYTFGTFRGLVQELEQLLEWYVPSLAAEAFLEKLAFGSSHHDYFVSVETLAEQDFHSFALVGREVACLEEGVLFHGPGLMVALNGRQDVAVRLEVEWPPRQG